MIRYTFRLGALVACLLPVLVTAAAAVTIFNDNFPTRADNSDIWGTAPTTTSAGVGVYVAVLDWPYSGKIDPYTPFGKVLKFDTSSGAATQMVYLPYSYTFGTDKVNLSITAGYGQFSTFNNFAVGFSNGSVFTDHLLIQDSQIQLNFPGTNTPAAIPFTFSPGTLYEFDLTYDPLKAGIAGLNPYTLAINGVMQTIPVTAATIYDPLTGFSGVAFGGRYSGGLTTRYITEFSLETTASVPEPSSLALLAAGGAALLLRRRRSSMR